MGTPGGGVSVWVVAGLALAMVRSVEAAFGSGNESAGSVA